MTGNLADEDVLTLSADDSELVGSDTVTITVVDALFKDSAIPLITTEQYLLDGGFVVPARSVAFPATFNTPRSGMRTTSRCSTRRLPG